jgi:hypothetical protein
MSGDPEQDYFADSVVERSISVQAFMLLRLMSRVSR